MRSSSNVVRAGVSAALSVGLAACAARGPADPSAATRPAPVATAPAAVEPALMTLAQAFPLPRLPSAPPATNPADPAASPPPLRALELYAEARALAESSPLEAIARLRSALELDPDSPTLCRELGNLYARSRLGHEQAIKWLDRAAELEPGDLATYLALGRQYMAKGDHAASAASLRLATATAEYAARPEAAVIVDLFLARAVAQLGYDTAALELYERVVERISGRLVMRGNPDVYVLLSRPEEIVFAPAGQLYARRGRWLEALRMFRLAAERDPTRLEYQARLADALLAVGCADEARELAAEQALLHRASPESVELLRRVVRRAGGQADFTEALRAVLARRPDDRALALSVADALASDGRPDDARALLESLVVDGRHDLPSVSRLVRFHEQRGEPGRAARVLVEALAARPDEASAFAELFDRLIDPTSGRRLRLEAFDDAVGDGLPEPVRLYWRARIERANLRRGAARATLQRASAAAARSPFGPVEHELLATCLTNPDWPRARRDELAESVARRAEAAGALALAAELRGVIAMHARRPDEAAAAFERAQRLGGLASPELRVAFGQALLMSDRTTRAEDVLWAVIRDRPSCGPAYATLLAHYRRRDGGSRRAALDVLQRWLRADPFGVPPRLLQAEVALEYGQRDAALAAVSRLLRDEPGDAAVLARATAWFTAAGRGEQFIARLEELRSRRPDDLAVAEALLEAFRREKRPPEEADRVLDGLAAAVGDDAERLYRVAGLAQRYAADRRAAELLLRKVLALDPAHPVANNDLGYILADDGRELAAAEAMVRLALASDPDNASFLDSLGWVLYKRGSFAEAHEHLARAAAAERPDAVVLDHLGDVLYRLSRPAEAIEQWRRSLSRVEETAAAEDDDQRQLKQRLEQKIRQQQAGHPVEVASVSRAGN